MTIAAQWLLEKQQQAREAHIRRLCETAIAIALDIRPRRELRRDASRFRKACAETTEKLRREVGR
jgi:hypothetical protein